MTAKLIAEKGLLEGQVISFKEGVKEWIIGRDPDQCHILIEDPSASRKHLICRLTPEGILAENLSDTNPLLINNEPISQPHLLQEGDLISIGEGIYRFESIPPADNIPEEDKELIPLQESSPLESEESAVPEEEAGFNHEEIYKDHEDSLNSSEFADIDFSLTDTSRYLLKVVAGQNNGAEFDLKPGFSYIVGTDAKNCDIIFQDVSVSRQHARLTLDEDGKITLKDLGSSNGTIINGEKLQNEIVLDINSLVTMGTTTFAVIDTQGERHTIISPLLPSIANILKREPPAEEEKEKNELTQETTQPTTPPPPIEQAPQKNSHVVLLAILTAILVIGGIGISLLFNSTEMASPLTDVHAELEKILKPYQPAVTYNFTPRTGRLFLSGHVLTQTDLDQLRHNIYALPVKIEIQDKLIVDEEIWKVFNQVLSERTGWRGVAIHSPAAGQFVMTGYLKSRKDYDQLVDYMSQNFSYLDLLDNKVVVEENIVGDIQQMLQENGLRDVQVAVSNGLVTLNGNIATIQTPLMNDILSKIKQIPGVTSVQNYTIALEVQEVTINISDRYHVSGSSQLGGRFSVVIDGKILSVGDILDGMRITEINIHAIFLQKGEMRYRIDY